MTYCQNWCLLIDKRAFYFAKKFTFSRAEGEKLPINRAIEIYIKKSF